eukprot:CAMPEP_0183508008 /NCGR_PEP_ID=MMETSP0371-20130417/8551_1 /TAXON_ID=268820 /ORGANISM="Peridinium aciculiferum, Strain PAER-2" /LENGTH=1113 /DNA_ID=CAMNT_0025704305 /DNA_START=68 /DNA_END=3409 /DNA_ORIENTATION=+
MATKDQDPKAAAALADQKGKESRNYEATEHKMSLEELKAKFETAIDLQNPKESKGLSEQEAKNRFLRDGPNAMTPPKQTPEIVKFLMQFTNMFMILLMVASALSFLAYGLDKTEPVNLYCGSALIIIVFLQCLASYLEERKSHATMNSLKSMMPSQCNVGRDGMPRRIPASELVIGDIVLLKGGDRVPADLRLIQTSGLKVESSSLTGEPDAFEMSVAHTHEEPFESKNLAFNTSQCTEGAAVGVVIRTSDRTLIGMVAKLATATKVQVSTLQKELSRIVKFITMLAFFLALCILIIGFAQGVPWQLVVNLVITVFCANIPQGLPATVTSCLGIAAKRMHNRHVLVKNLEVIETLGSASCICSDKTGTLTQNRMTVQNFWFNNSFEMLQGAVVIGATSSAASAHTAQDMLHGKNEKKTKNSVTESATQVFVRWRSNPLEPLLLVAAVCNSAKFAAGEGPANENVNLSGPLPELQWFEADKSGPLPDLKAVAPPGGKVDELVRTTSGPQRVHSGISTHSVSGAAVTSRTEKAKATGEILGDASEAALLRYCESIYPVDRIRKLYALSFDQPFNSTNKYALCVVDPPGNEAPGKQYIFLKGAPEVVVERCSTWLCAGQNQAIDEDFKSKFLQAYERFAMAGERVLGFAKLVIDKMPADQMTAANVPSSGFMFLGLASLMDPPKDGVDKAVDECHHAGIRVFMVTGDHALTAEAIAHKVHIITKPTRLDLAHERGCAVEDIDPHDPEIKAIVIAGHELRQLDEAQWGALLDHDQIVFARTTPQQKLEIVERLQKRGEIVAVTGDGVNDAPALKAADIGVAMGNPNASDVARDAADIIILDDDFCSIVSAIREGRLLFDNLKKSVVYTLTHLVPEMVPVFLNIVLLFPLGLSSLLILTIDLGSELVPAISLAYELPENAIMSRAPRNIKTDRMVTWQVLCHSYLFAGVVESLFSILAFFCVFWTHGVALADLCFPDSKLYFSGSDAPVMHSNGRDFSADEQSKILSVGNSAVYANIILCQMFHIWFCRTRATSVTQHPLFSNKLTLMAMPWELGFIAIFCFIPEMEVVFISGLGLPVEFWCLSLGFLGWVTLHTECLKFFARRYMAGRKSFLGKLAW